ncbi:hypothetical protein LXL04_004621 [Taraxacum kok-saghyz]
MQSQQLNNVFLTLQTCMKEIIEVQGGNNYHVLHIGKSRLGRQDNLPLQIGRDQTLIDDVVVVHTNHEEDCSRFMNMGVSVHENEEYVDINNTII